MRSHRSFLSAFSCAYLRQIYLGERRLLLDIREFATQL